MQFIYRERISPQGVALAGTMDVSSGSYPLTTSLSDIHWHTDTPGVTLAPFAPRNAYLDQGSGAAHSSAPMAAAIFDRPSTLPPHRMPTSR